MKYEELTEEIIRIFYKVYNSLGYGFPEKIYERALMIEFRKSGLSFENQFPVKIYYDGEDIGGYAADFVVDGKVVVEIKAIRELTLNDENQLLNYLTSTDKEVGLLLNFGVEPEVKRKIYDNEKKKYFNQISGSRITRMDAD